MKRLLFIGVLILLGCGNPTTIEYPPPDVECITTIQVDGEDVIVLSDDLRCLHNRINN